MEIKKNEKYDLERRRPLFFGIGMIISISLAITAFEWRTEVEPICTFNVSVEPTDVFLPPITINTPPPPPPKAIIIQAVPDKKIVLDDPIEIDIDPEIINNDDFMLIPVLPIDEEVDEAPRSYAEVMPSFEGGMDKFYEFMGKNIKYPKSAQRMNVEGRVFVQFIVEKDGSLRDLRVIKGIGASCDQEALRVMGLIPKFKPGKQGDVRVPVKMIIPINFKLN